MFPTQQTTSTFTPKKCMWEGCNSSTSFQREGDLIRHLKTIHISPDAYPCHEAKCSKTFGRNDHLQNHLRKRHGY
ncbi:hypothetical protein BJX63DRAFT_416095 [Aspergillus granulosus]|uniref:C2H2-type domain-containing protein n=1 Tax=Aspergillus granulosus TaxID=176169 RepID=A0ABR4GSW4_9EURO